MEIRYLGHSCFELSDGDTGVLVDPFLTGNPKAAAEAAELVGARTVIPCHYGIFRPIETDVQAFKSDVEAGTSSQVVVLDPGGSHTV